MEKISILIVDDHALVRQAWAFILNSHPRFVVVAETGDGEEAVSLAMQTKPHIVLMDINLPGLSGIEVTRKIRKFAPGSKVIGVSLHTQPAYVQKMIREGAHGYVTKNSSKEEMFQALTEVHEGKKYICEQIKTIISEKMINQETEAPGINSLTQRELEIIQWIMKGHSSKEIAEKLFVSSKTVEVHRFNILRKMGLKNTAALVNHINHTSLDLQAR